MTSRTPKSKSSGEPGERQPVPHWLSRHWVTPLMFVPTVVLWGLYCLFGFSTGHPYYPVRDPIHWPEFLRFLNRYQIGPSFLFELTILVSFYVSVGFYLAHTIWMGRRGFGGVRVKCWSLAVGWLMLSLAIVALS